MNWAQVVGLFGGTFDPPHQAHRLVVETILEQLQLKKVIVLPSAFPPMKSGTTAFEHRYKMAQLQFEGASKVEVSDFENHLVGPSYTVRTVLELKKTYPEIVFIVGVDQIPEFHQWHQFPELLGVCHWVIEGRQPYGIEHALPYIQKWSEKGYLSPLNDSEWRVSETGTVLKLMNTPAPAVSSTEIRDAIRSEVSELLHPRVASYLKEYRLYDTGAER